MTRLLVTGVAVIDFVFHLDAMPRTAEKHRARAATITGGGNAANAATAIARLGGTVRLATRLGDDEVAGLIEAGLRRENIEMDLVRRFAGHHSAFSSVFVAGDERQIVSFRDWSMPREADWLDGDAIPDTAPFDAALADTRWPEGAAATMRLARAAGRPAVVDAEAPLDECAEALELATHVAFGAQGLRDFCGHDDLEQGLREADARLPGTVLVTDGEHGTVWFEHGRRRHAPAVPVQAVDTLAAGDVWHGAFALRLAQAAAGGGQAAVGGGQAGTGGGDDLATAVRYANAAASLKCTRIGGRDGAPTADEVETFMEPPCN